MKKEELYKEIEVVDKRIHNARSYYVKKDLRKYRKKLVNQLKKLEGGCYNET